MDFYKRFLNEGFFGKVLNLLVLGGLMIIVLELLALIPIDFLNFHFLHYEFLGAVILGIFALELYGDYHNSKSSRHFLKNHLIDCLLIGFLSFYVIFVSVLEVLHLLVLNTINMIFLRLKHFRVLYLHFKMNFFILPVGIEEIYRNK